MGKIYEAENVLLSATHTHSGPGGYMQYALFQSTSFGFVEQTFNTIADGITKVCILCIFVKILKTDKKKKRHTSQNWPLVKNPQFLPYPHETW